MRADVTFPIEIEVERKQYEHKNESREVDIGQIIQTEVDKAMKYIFKTGKREEDATEPWQWLTDDTTIIDLSYINLSDILSQLQYADWEEWDTKEETE